MAKEGAQAGEVMGPAELKTMLHLAKRKPVSCAVGMTKDKQGVILLHKRTKPRKLMAELLRGGKGSGLELDRATIRFGRASVDGGSDSSTVTFTVNKEAPGPLRMKLVDKLRPAGFQRCEIVVDAKLEDESDEEEPEEGEEQAAAQPTHQDAGTPAHAPALSDQPATPPAPTGNPAAAAGQAMGAQPDGATLKATLRGLAEQIRLVIAADPSRGRSLVTLATAARDSLVGGDLASAQSRIASLRQQLPTTGAGSPATPTGSPAADPLLTPVRQTAQPPSATMGQVTGLPGLDSMASDGIALPNPAPGKPGQPDPPPPIDPASLPPGPLGKADYETFATRNRHLAGLYDPNSLWDRAENVVTGAMNDPARVMTDAQRTEHAALSGKIIDTLLPRPTPDEARMDAMEASPLGAIASTVTRGLGGNQASQDAALDLGSAADGIGMGLAVGRGGTSQGPVSLASRRGVPGLPPRRAAMDEPHAGEQISGRGIDVAQDPTGWKERSVAGSSARTVLRTQADPARRVLGSAVDSHPTEVAKITGDFAKAGAKVVSRSEDMAYAPGTSGKAGDVYLAPNASYSAWLHEYQHFLDDQKAGWRGSGQLMDYDVRVEMERNAYQREIDLMHSLGHDDIVEELERNREEEFVRLREFFGRD